MTRELCKWTRLPTVCLMAALGRRSHSTWRLPSGPRQAGVVPVRFSMDHVRRAALSHHFDDSIRPQSDHFRTTLKGVSRCAASLAWAPFVFCNSRDSRGRGLDGHDSVATNTCDSRRIFLGGLDATKSARTAAVFRRHYNFGFLPKNYIVQVVRLSVSPPRLRTGWCTFSAIS